VRPYGELGLARIAATAEEFVQAADHAMQNGMSLKWRERSDAFLQTLSWDSVWAEMNRLIHSRLRPGSAENQAPSSWEEVARV
jgi:UDP-galactopyranose mutase